MAVKLKDLENKHFSQMGFVIGSGPSLHYQRMEPLHNYVTITVNAGIIKFPDCDYFVSDDEGIKAWSYYEMFVKGSKCLKLLYKKKLQNAEKEFSKDELLFFDHKTWYDPSKNKYYPDGLIMTRKTKDPIIGARTSLATAIHWAYIMGCDPIVLLGCDCCYQSNKRYFWEFAGEAKPYRIDGRSSESPPSRGAKNNKKLDKHCVDFLDYWKQFWENNRHRANIIYASEGGVLDCFPKMNLIDVLKKYGNRKKL